MLAVPELNANEPSSDFFLIVNSAVSYLVKSNDSARVNIISDQLLAAEYAKIILHSFGLRNQQIRILNSAQELSPNGEVELAIFGKLSLDNQDYFRKRGIKLREGSEISKENYPVPSRDSGNADYDTAIIVLGTGPLDETTPSLDMVKRVEAGVRLLKDNQYAILIFSGGRTCGNISEARMMALIAFARGVSPSDVILEEFSRSTVENAQYTAEIVKKLQLKKIILVSRPTHLERAERIFSKHPEFMSMQIVGTHISKKEVIKNFLAFLAYRDNQRTRQILHKIIAEY